MSVASDSPSCPAAARPARLGAAHSCLALVPGDQTVPSQPPPLWEASSSLLEPCLLPAPSRVAELQKPKRIPRLLVPWQCCPIAAGNSVLGCPCPLLPSPSPAKAVAWLQALPNPELLGPFLMSQGKRITKSHCRLLAPKTRARLKGTSIMLPWEGEGPQPRWGQAQPQVTMSLHLTGRVAPAG